MVQKDNHRIVPKCLSNSGTIFEASSEVPLFNPCTDSWQEHFLWSTDTLSIIGLTPTGRATVAALAFNRARIINIRAADREIGRHPPPDDPIQS